MKKSQTLPCLIGQAACGRIDGEPICAQCGMDSRAVFLSKEDREAAQARSMAVFWENHAKALDAELKRTKRELTKTRGLAEQWEQHAGALEGTLNRTKAALKRAKESSVGSAPGAEDAPIQSAATAGPTPAPAKTALSPGAAWPFPTGNKP